MQLTAARKKRYGDAPSQNIPALDPAAPEDAPSAPSTDSDLLEEREAVSIINDRIFSTTLNICKI